MRASHGASKLAAELLSKPKRLLTTVLLGNMVVNVVFFSVSFLLIVEHREKLGPTGSRLLAIAALLTIMIFCEVLPKNLAVILSRPLSRFAAFPLAFMQKLLAPFIVVLERITDWISSILGRQFRPEPLIRAEELQMLIDLSRREGALDRDIGGMIADVIRLSGIPLREIMIPRVEMVCFDIAAAAEMLGGLFRDKKHRLIPVYEGRVDNVLGIIHAKDFLLRQEDEDLRELIRSIPFLPESATVEDALSQLRQQHVRMAFVVDEYGALAGLVTLEDILEEIVGEIGDEYDAEAPLLVERIGERRFRLKGELSMHEWCEVFKTEPAAPSVATVGGLMMALLGKMPEAGDSVRHGDLKLTVERTRGPRVASVIVELTDGDTEVGRGEGRRGG